MQRSRAKNEIRSLWQRDFIWSTAFWFASYSGKECLQILTTFFFPFSKRHHRRKYIQETIKWNFLILLWWLLCTYYQLYCPIIFLRNHLCQGGTVRDRNLTHVPKKKRRVHIQCHPYRYEEDNINCSYSLVRKLCVDCVLQLVRVWRKCHDSSLKLLRIVKNKQTNKLKIKFSTLKAKIIFEQKKKLQVVLPLTSCDLSSQCLWAFIHGFPSFFCLFVF